MTCWTKKLPKRPEEEDIIKRKQCAVELLKALIWKEKLLYQMAKSKWILEGDANTSLYHSWINCKHKFNSIDGLNIDGTWTESVAGEIYGVFRFFKDHFSQIPFSRPEIPSDLLGEN